MKKLFAVLLSALLLCGIMTPAFAAEEVPDKPELIAAEIISIPEKNKFVRKNGEPEFPDGIVLKLHYSDGSILKETVVEQDGEYYADAEKVVYVGKVTDQVQYGLLTAYLEMKDGEIELSYLFYSEEPESDSAFDRFMQKLAIWMEYVSIELFWLHERVLNYLYQFFRFSF